MKKRPTSIAVSQCSGPSKFCGTAPPCSRLDGRFIRSLERAHGLHEHTSMRLGQARFARRAVVVHGAPRKRYSRTPRTRPSWSHTSTQSPLVSLTKLRYAALAAESSTSPSCRTCMTFFFIKKPRSRRDQIVDLFLADLSFTATDRRSQ